MGRTNTTAWALTSSRIDSTDWYEETIKDDKYYHDGQWKQMKKRSETIKVRFGEDVKYDIYYTNHGLDIDCPVF